MNDIPKIPTEQSSVQSITVERVTTQKTVNSVLIVAIVIIFTAMIASYFVPELGAALGVSLKTLTTDGAWLAVGSFAVSTLVKQVAIERAKLTREYTDAKKTADTKLKRYNDDGLLVYAKEYCEDYEKAMLENDRKYLLEPVGITYADFERLYLAKSLYYLLRQKELSFKQALAVWRANRVKRVRYNADFLRTTVRMKRKKSPSQINDDDKANALDTVKSFIFSFLGGAFAVSITTDIIVSFSTAALIAAGIKVAIVVMTSALRAAFGWRLITVTRVNRLELQISESISCIKWSAQKYPDYFQGKVIPKESEAQVQKNGNPSFS